jgi:hypothetical protein
VERRLRGKGEGGEEDGGEDPHGASETWMLWKGEHGNYLPYSGQSQLYLFLLVD